MKELSQAREHQLQKLLVLFEIVFQESYRLPPKCDQKHAITLIEGWGLVNVWPYRYPQNHKNELEKQVLELLKTRVIRPSQSAFSSLVILVKKKDDT